MKVLLLNPERDTLPQPAPYAAELEQDMGLHALIEAAGDGEELWRQSFREVLLSAPYSDLQEALYRQNVLRDVIAKPDEVLELYQLAQQALETARRAHFGFSWRKPSSALYGARELTVSLLSYLKKLRLYAKTKGGAFKSPAFTSFFERARQQLNDEFFASASALLAELSGQQGYWLSVALGAGLQGSGYKLRLPPRRAGLLGFLQGPRPKWLVTVADRDVAGARALADIRERGIAEAAAIVSGGAGSLLSFFENLRYQLAFYLAAANLRRELLSLGLPVCFPEPGSAGSGLLNASSLYEPGLALRTGGAVVGNDLAADAKSLLLISGANKGGKTTFLRALGVAQLMMQAGLFVAAKTFAAEVRQGIFSHFVQAEEEGLERGKFEEELARLSQLLKKLGPDSLLLLNETFSSTYEHEASEVASELLGALLKVGVRVYFVTHLFEFAGRECRQGGRALCLRAERKPGGERTFRILPGAPEATSYAADLMERLMGDEI